MMAETSPPKPGPRRCPSCGQPVDQAAATFPFCSQRCRLVDLNRWFQGDYKISRPVEETDLEEG